MDECIFCQIIAKKINSVIISETADALAISDINPKAKIHYLLIPKKHIPSLLSSGAEKEMEQLIVLAQNIAQKENIAGFKIKINVGKEGGQEIGHLHLHFLSD